MSEAQREVPCSNIWFFLRNASTTRRRRRHRRRLRLGPVNERNVVCIPVPSLVAAAVEVRVRCVVVVVVVVVVVGVARYQSSSSSSTQHTRLIVGVSLLDKTILLPKNTTHLM